jgi:hypothetical protein
VRNNFSPFAASSGAAFWVLIEVSVCELTCFCCAAASVQIMQAQQTTEIKIERRFI